MENQRDLAAARQRAQVGVGAQSSRGITGVVLPGDRGFDHDTLRDHGKAGGGLAIIPGKSNRTAPPSYIPEIGKQHRGG
jgi:hypothetical protein